MNNMRKKVEFPGSNNVMLAGLLELPGAELSAIALFAHCFTCGKDIASASRISRALVSRGIGVMRFDFTGLGGSDGDFSNTNFSSNIEDLVAAADYLRDNFQPPTILIGHSLGGTAVLNAAAQVPESTGVVTIGSPADAEHVVKQFCSDVDQINKEGYAEVDLAGRKFTVKKQFIDDAKAQSSIVGADLKKALLVFHSPVDNIVSIKEAEKIYHRAKHPKSFISLGNADHLLTNKQDAEYVASTIATWAVRLVESSSVVNQVESNVNRGELLVEEQNHDFTRNMITDHHFWLADEPVDVGGANLGPDPYEHLLAALGSCTSMTLRMYANRKDLKLDDVRVSLSHTRQHGEDCAHCDEENAQIGVLRRTISLKGDLTEKERQRLLQIADRCPVHRTLEGKIVIETHAGQEQS
jgi:putative redox protein